MSKNTIIGLIVAVKDEADIVASALHLELQPVHHGSYLLYSAPGSPVVLLTPGLDAQFESAGQPVSRVGKVSAGVITTILVERYNPEIIINCGTGGGIKPAPFEVGDVVFADYVMNHDIRFPVEGYDEYGARRIKTRGLERLAFMHSPHKYGIVSSGESFAAIDEEWPIIRGNNAQVRDMEAAGVVQALQILKYDRPYYVIKSVTEMADESTSDQESQEQFEKNFGFAMSELSQVVRELVDNVDRLLQTK